MGTRERSGCSARVRNFRYYFDVRDVDALYAELKPKLDKLPKGDVHGPADKPYHERELLILASGWRSCLLRAAIVRAVVSSKSMAIDLMTLEG